MGELVNRCATLPTFVNCVYAVKEQIGFQEEALVLGLVDRILEQQTVSPYTTLGRIVAILFLACDRSAIKY